MVNNFKSLALLLVSFIFITSVFAWGKRGHNITAEIAFNYLSDSDKAKLMSYLQGMTIEEASNWLDEVRSQPQYKYTAPWHYINIPSGEMYRQDDKPNVVNALTHSIMSLQTNEGLSSDDIRFNLLVLIHLMGDIYQPLHDGYASDKGGNDYQVSFLGKGSNLHRVWDSEIIETQNITLEDCLAEAKKVSHESLLKFYQVTPARWMEASRSLVQGCYPTNHKIDESYIREKAQVIKKQLAIAGLRLGAMLTIIAPKLPTVKEQSIPATKQIIELSLDSLSKHIGETAHVCGKVFDTKYLTSAQNSPTFINIGAAYPNSLLTLFIWQDVRNTFSYPPDTFLQGKKVCVTGTLVLYKGKPEMIIKSERDIEVSN